MVDKHTNPSVSVLAHCVNTYMLFCLALRACTHMHIGHAHTCMHTHNLQTY